MRLERVYPDEFPNSFVEGYDLNIGRIQRGSQPYFSSLVLFIHFEQDALSEISDVL